MELSRKTLQGLSELIHRLCGLVVGEDKAYLVRHRLEPVVRGEGLAGFEHLLERLQSRGGSHLHDKIIEAITTKETSFFRDRAFFDALRDEILPQSMAALEGSGGHRHRIRIWSAGCSTGQECYSLAMLICDRLAAERTHRPQSGQFSILASDISTEALEYARAGCYSGREVARGLSETTLRRYFHQRDKHWVISEAPRRLVQFRRMDLLRAPAGLGPFDLVLCRNVLIYFDGPTRRRVCQGLYRVLQPGGWLALGSAESLFEAQEKFESVKIGRLLLYRRPQRGR